MTPAPPPERHCPRCKEWRKIAIGADGCNECIKLLGSAYRKIDDTADRARAQAFARWANGGLP